jgi:hypothetical protein
MSVTIKITTSEDIEYEGVLLFAPAANYSDGPEPGFRPAIRFALLEIPSVVHARLEMPSNIHASGLFNLKDEDKQETLEAAKNIAREYLFSDNCLCQSAINHILETFAAEA